MRIDERLDCGSCDISLFSLRNWADHKSGGTVERNAHDRIPFDPRATAATTNNKTVISPCFRGELWPFGSSRPLHLFRFAPQLVGVRLLPQRSQYLRMKTEHGLQRMRVKRFLLWFSRNLESCPLQRFRFG
jgi:hypothetical protein